MRNEKPPVARKKKKEKSVLGLPLRYIIGIDIIMFYNQFSISIRFIVAKCYVVAS